MADETKKLDPKVLRPSTPEFDNEIRVILETFSMNQLISLNASYITAFSQVTELSFVQNEILPDLEEQQMTFAVVPMPTDDGSEVQYRLIANESCLYPMCRQFLTGKDPKESPLTDEEKKLTTFNQVEELFCDKFGIEEGVQKLRALLRYILMHESLHIFLAHLARDSNLLRKFGLSMYGDDGQPVQNPVVKHALKLFNQVEDAFINEGLDYLHETNEPRQEAVLKKTFEDLSGPTTSSEFRREHGHLYRFSREPMQKSSVSSSDLVDLADEFRKKIPEKETAMHEALSVFKSEFNDGGLLKKYTEEDINEVFLRALLIIKDEDPDSLSGMSTGSITLPGGDSVNAVFGPNGEIVAIIPDGLKSGAAAESMEGTLRNDALGMIERADSYASETDNGEDRSRGVGSVFNRQLQKIEVVSFPWDKLMKGFIATLRGRSEKRTWDEYDLLFSRVPRHIDGKTKYGVKFPAIANTYEARENFAMVLFVDASGSMSNEEIAKVLGGIMTTAASKIQRVYIVFHDTSAVNMAESKFAQSSGILKRFRRVFDQDILKQFGVISIETAGNRRHIKKIAEFLTEVAKDLPQGGTSHVQPVHELHERGFFKAIREVVSGVVMYTDCESDIEILRTPLSEAFEASGIRVDTPTVILNSRLTKQYSCDDFPVLNADGTYIEAINASKPQHSRSR